LISLKKIVAAALHSQIFLIKWEKVQLSGEKCFFRNNCGVSGSFVHQSRCQGSAFHADPAP
jgi:hypothetical protein